MVLNGCQAAGEETAQLTKRAILHFISQSVCILCVCFAGLNAILTCVSVRVCVCVHVQMCVSFFCFFFDEELVRVGACCTVRPCEKKFT